MILSDQAHQFLKHGIRPTTQRATEALLDELASFGTAAEVQNFPSTPAQFERMQRESQALKRQRDQAIDNTRRAFDKQHEQRRAIEKTIAEKKAAKAAFREKMRGGKTAAAVVKSTLPRPAPAKPAKPAAPASKTPHLDRLEKLRGKAAAAYIKAHTTEINLEQLALRRAQRIARI